ncbi:hypothetical protein [Brevundimonas sp. FT23028]|uniref:hypothetical protein n=1 Tax=Brevundimonas sp. FT23028 TaxID=3393748 RepID=UPI003B587F3D
MIIAALLASLVLPQEPAAPPPVETTLTIEVVGPSPEFGSGYLFVTFWATGRADDGQLTKHYVLYMGQPLPSVGARCVFRSTQNQIDYVEGEQTAFREPRPAVTSYDCGNRRFPAETGRE